MKKQAVVLVAVVLFIFASMVSVFAVDLAWEDIGRGNLNLKTVLVETENPQIIYIGSGQGIFKSEDGGESWRSILSSRGTNKGVNFLLFALYDKNSLYAATGNGLYQSLNRGKSWNRLFRGKNYLENECTALAISPSAIYLGTRGGLFVSKDKGRSWCKETGKLGNSEILAIAYNPNELNYIYVVCADGVFKTSDAGKNWERIFVAHPVENGDNGDEVIEDQDEPGRFSDIKYVTIDPNNLNCLYVATSKGVYRSQDKGKSWEMLSDYGLLNKEIKFLLISLKSTIYAVTKSGIFEYTNERWHELSLGLTAEDIRFLAQDNQGNLYAATQRGLFKANLSNTQGNEGTDAISLYSQGEPDIHAVQQAAIKYAEVEPEKIKEWRKKAKMKAILPRLTVGIDKSESTNYEIYTSATTKYVYEGPYDKSDGWDVSLSWELSDLIWSEAQTSIDVRSRLMVELRDDILDEVTKLYFERLRVKMEFDSLSIEDRKKRFEKELKLRELAAILDGLTGGYFSRQCRMRQSF